MLEKVSQRSVTCHKVETCNKYVFLPLSSRQLTDLPQDNHICSFILLPFILLCCFQKLKDIPFKLGMERPFQHLFLPSFLFAFFFPSFLVSNSLISSSPLLLWAYRSVGYCISGPLPSIVSARLLSGRKFAPFFMTIHS